MKKDLPVPEKFDIRVHKSEDEYLIEQFMKIFDNPAWQEKELVNKIDVLCKTIIRLIDSEFPAPKKAKMIRSPRNDLFRYMYMIHAQRHIGTIHDTFVDAYTG